MMVCIVEAETFDTSFNRNDHGSIDGNNDFMNNSRSERVDCLMNLTLFIKKTFSTTGEMCFTKYGIYILCLC